MFPGTEENNSQKPGLEDKTFFQSLKKDFFYFFGKKTKSLFSSLFPNWKKEEKWLSERLASLGAQIKGPLKPPK